MSYPTDRLSFNMLSEKSHQHGSVHRATRAVLFADIVESTRLLENDEHETIARWRCLVERVELSILPENDGRLVHSLGDGLLLDFPNVQSAVGAAFAIQETSNDANKGLPSNRHILLRMGIEISDVLVDEHDVYGRGVMLGARLMTLAGPGEIVVSAHVRDQLTPVLDADVEDLGECFLKHLADPVRAYRIGPPGPNPVIAPGLLTGDLHPTLAVVPFSARSEDNSHHMLGDVLADEIISALSRWPDLNVISRLSTTAFGNRDIDLHEIKAHLKANYVLSGAYRIYQGELTLDVELAEVKSERVVWTSQLSDKLAGVLSAEPDVIDHVVAGVGRAILSREQQRALSQALPTVESYTLLMAAIAHMHRLSPRDFERAHQLLQALVERAPRQAIPQAWLAKWHVLRVPQGWSSDLREDIRLAQDLTKRALDADPCCSLALAIDGWIHTSLLKQFDTARERYDLAIETNPNDGLAWLLKGTLHAFKGEGQRAVRDTQRSLKLSPLDPHRYFFDSLAATAELAARRFDRALDLADRSLRANRTHTSTLRVMTIAQWCLGREKDARKSAQDLRRLQPEFSVRGYLERHPAAEFETGKVWADALRQAGVPE